jgi:hypothetical protein
MSRDTQENRQSSHNFKHCRTFKLIKNIAAFFARDSHGFIRHALGQFCSPLHLFGVIITRNMGVSVFANIIDCLRNSSANADVRVSGTKI